MEHGVGAIGSPGTEAMGIIDAVVAWRRSGVDVGRPLPVAERLFVRRILVPPLGAGGDEGLRLIVRVGVDSDDVSLDARGRVVRRSLARRNNRVILLAVVQEVANRRKRVAGLGVLLRAERRRSRISVRHPTAILTLLGVMRRGRYKAVGGAAVVVAGGRAKRL